MGSRREALERAALARARGQGGSPPLKAAPWRAASALSRASLPREPSPSSALGWTPLLGCALLCAVAAAPFALAWGAAPAQALLACSGLFAACVGGCSSWARSRAAHQARFAGAFHRACLAAFEPLAPERHALACADLAALGRIWGRRHSREEPFLRQADALAREALGALSPAPSPEEALAALERLRSWVSGLI